MRQLKITPSITMRTERSLDIFLQEISKIPLLTEEEEVHLAIRARNGDKVAIDKLVTANLRFVVSVAKQYSSQSFTLSDFIGFGYAGLLRAPEKYDPSRGFKFISYAVWWIRQSIHMELGEHERMVRLPQNKVHLDRKVNEAMDNFEQEHGYTPTDEDLAELLNVRKDDVSVVLSQKGGHYSLDETFGEDEGLNGQDLLIDESGETPDSSLLEEDRKTAVRLVLKSLPVNHRRIVEYYYGINRPRNMSLEEIGRNMDLSSERVRQILKTSLQRLRRSKEVFSFLLKNVA